MNVAGKPRSIPAAASSRATISGGRPSWAAPRLSCSWASRRAPMIGWMAGDRARVQAMATCDAVAPRSSAADWTARCWAVILAYGIDVTAHRAALGCSGRAVAVPACGPDLAYPREHAGLLDDIATHGAVVSEYLPGMPPARHRFLARNGSSPRSPAGPWSWKPRGAAPLLLLPAGQRTRPAGDGCSRASHVRNIGRLPCPHPRWRGGARHRCRRSGQQPAPRAGWR
jgi:hypothetical protein